MIGGFSARTGEECTAMGLVELGLVGSELGLLEELVLVAFENTSSSSSSTPSQFNFSWQGGGWLVVPGALQCWGGGGTHMAAMN